MAASHAPDRGWACMLDPQPVFLASMEHLYARVIAVVGPFPDTDSLGGHMNSIATGYQWLAAPPATMSLLSVGAYHVGSAFVGALVMPDTTSSKLYRFFFAFTNALAANYARSKASVGPAGEQPPKP